MWHKLFSPNNKSIWGIIGLCMLNLIVMHFHIVFTCPLESPPSFIDYTDNFFGIIVDVVFVFTIFYILSGKRIKIALGLTFFCCLLWSFSNVMYSRFFRHYLSLSAISQGNVMFNDWMIRCVLEKWGMIDLLFPLFILFYIKLAHQLPSAKNVFSYYTLLKILFISILAELTIFAIICAYNPDYRYITFYFHKLYKRHIEIDAINPVLRHFSRGSVRTIASEVFSNLQGSIELSKEQKDIISGVISESQNTVDTLTNISPKNIIFILVESYMSFSSDMKIQGKEVTPYLNALKKDTSCYYNGKVHENITIGESSDGQLIYMTGLLPLRSTVTVTKAKNNSLPGIPKFFKRTSAMIIPSTSTVWEQESMCKSYGFNYLYASTDYADGTHTLLNDQQVFEFAQEVDEKTSMPFFSVIITMTMHQPYTKQIDPTFLISDPSINKELACYLNACHYTDSQIGKYIEYLKQKHIYDNSLIIIAADHAVHDVDFGDISEDIPLYIIYPEGLPKMWDGACNQIDLYPTIIDLLGIKGKWCGLGKSLVSDDYDNEISTQKWDVSEWLLFSNYFDNSHSPLHFQQVHVKGK